MPVLLADVLEVEFAVVLVMVLVVLEGLCWSRWSCLFLCLTCLRCLFRCWALKCCLLKCWLQKCWRFWYCSSLVERV